ncbi:MAG: hypothetical protein D3923_05470 [Candidatus Electrothrix sp. AR3]|nr:hypothetical protein [Candidatus Electrothrix sp. AR3]
MKLTITELLSAKYNASCSSLGLEYEKIHDLSEFTKRSATLQDIQLTDNIVVNLQPQIQSISELGYMKMLYRGLTWYYSKECLPPKDFKANYDTPPLVELLPSGTEGFYSEIAAYGKKIDKENFYDYVPFFRTVHFNDYTFSYRKINPRENEYPVMIEVDRRPFKHIKVG